MSHAFIVTHRQNSVEAIIPPPTDKVISAIDSLADSGSFSVMLSGGEPTMHPGSKDILAAATDRMRMVRIASILYALTEDDLRTIINNDTVTVQTSLDGLPATHDRIRGGASSFERTVSTIRALAEQDKIVIVAMTANRHNWCEVEGVVRHCMAAGAAAFRLGLTFPSGRAANSDLCLSAEEISSLQKNWETIVKKYSSPTFSLNRSEESDAYQEFISTRGLLSSCGAGHLLAHIRANGSINPCPMLNVNLGNIYEQPFDAAFSGPLFSVFANSLSPGIDRCADCGAAPFCGRCHAAAAAWGRTDDHCWWRTSELAKTLGDQGRDDDTKI
ncbi:radical SAM/SPASM domain-containing protein [uncultured Propionibacterium sp.]|uniref:radical SAM/SPASM domain-containing protein n=1 Tax=uncultured Propionibacterium sp. TaxID=218066 RepID=UPI00293083E4|nr:radical SAM protein [uncultured Propionibacterium sp.]